MDIKTGVVMPCKCPACGTTMVATVTRTGVLSYVIKLAAGLAGKRPAFMILDDVADTKTPDKSVIARWYEETFRGT